MENRLDKEDKKSLLDKLEELCIIEKGEVAEITIKTLDKGILYVDKKITFK